MVFSDKKSQRVERWEVFFETECSSLLVKKAKIGCKIGACCVGIFLYADDIILLAPSVQALQSPLVYFCMQMTLYCWHRLFRLYSHCLIFVTQNRTLCMTLNLKNLTALWRYKNACANVMVSGLVVNWVTSVRCL